MMTIDRAPDASAHDDLDYLAKCLLLRSALALLPPPDHAIAVLQRELVRLHEREEGTP